MKCIGIKPVWLGIECEIDNTLEALQEYVGGYIEVVPLSAKVVVICNEEGKINNLHTSASLLQRVRHCTGVYKVGELRLVDVFFGQILLCGVDGDEFCDLPEGEIEVTRFKENEKYIASVTVGDWVIKAC